MNPIERAIWYGHPAFSSLRGLSGAFPKAASKPQAIITHSGPNRKQRRANKKNPISFLTGLPIPTVTAKSRH